MEKDRNKQRFKHAPSLKPWTYVLRKDEDGNNDGSILSGIETGRAECVCKAPRFAEQGDWEANARLICRAPEMLVLLRSTNSLMTMLLSDPDNAELNQKFEEHRERINELYNHINGHD